MFALTSIQGSAMSSVLTIVALIGIAIASVILGFLYESDAWMRFAVGGIWVTAGVVIVAALVSVVGVG